jgi:P4 family phage/plasmid primase-like protien
VGVGRNGKGQFMTLIRRFIGLENCTSTDLDRLSNSQFEASKLYKKKAAFVGETDHSTLKKTSILKALSGGDLVSCEFKRADAFDFKNTAKIIIASNSLPPTTDRTEGFYRRWMIVEFNGRFKEGKDIIDTIPEWEYENLCRKCIRLLKDLLQRGTFDGEGSIEERMKAYEKKSNPVTTFIDDCCILDSTAYCPTWYLYEKYQEFQAIGGHRKLTEREFSIQLKNIGYEIEQKSYTPEMAARFGKGSNSDEDKRRNWRTVMGVDYKTTDESVAHVAHVEDILLRNSHIRKLSRNGATCATCATTEENAPIVSSICKFVEDYRRKFNKVVTKRDVVGLSIEYCNKNGYHDIPSVADVIRKHLGIYVTEGYGEAENNGNGSLSGV